MPASQSAKVPECQDAKVPEIQDATVLENLRTRKPGHHTCSSAKLPVYQKPKAPKSHSASEPQSMKNAKRRPGFIAEVSPQKTNTRKNEGIMENVDDCGSTREGTVISLMVQIMNDDCFANGG